MATSLWETRGISEQALGQSLRPFADVLTDAFQVVDDLVGNLELVGTPFGRVRAAVAVKARNLALACYSLSLDGLAQESGALFRVLLESLELLQYLRDDPKRLSEALNGQLPSAGQIAKQINGRFKGLRDHLNAHASHLSLSSEAMNHLVDHSQGRLRTVQPYSERVLRTNLRTLLSMLVWLAIEAANCCSIAEGRVEDVTAGRVEDLKRRAFEIFDGAIPS